MPSSRRHSSLPQRRASKPSAGTSDCKFMSTKRNVVAIIDDNLSILGAMSRLLSALGYHTELYASAKEFLDAAMMTEAICLVVDVQLGESCGIEFAQHLAKTGFKIPIIFMSAHNNDAVKRRAAELGCVAFLIKPFSADVLIDTLAALPPRRPV
jgi:FixJ family two-component response regulator